MNSYYDEEPERKPKQIHYKLPWKTAKPNKQKQQPVKVRQIQTKKPVWNDSKQGTGLFDPNLKANTIRNEKVRNNANFENQQYEEQFEKINKQAAKDHKPQQDARTRTAKVLEEKMERERQVYESYHTLAQIQELTNKENARKNAAILGKHQKELQQLRWMLDQENKEKEDHDKIQQERYQKLLQQKQLNLSLKKKMMDQKRHQTNLHFKRNAEIEHGQPNVQVKEEHPPAEYIKDLMWEKDPRPVQRGVVNIHDDKEDVTNENQANKRVTLFQKKQKQVNENLEIQLMDLQREQARRNYEVDNLIELHKDHMAREKELQNKHFSAIETKVQKLKGVLDPLEENMQRKKDEDKFRGNFIAKATAQMIQTYNEKITDMLIDDLLYETVGLLQEQEEREKRESFQMKRDMIMLDYTEEFKNLVEEQAQIEERLKHKYKSLDLYPGPSYKQKQYLQDPIVAKYVGIELSLGQIANILESKNLFHDNLYKLSHYSRKNLECFTLITEELIDEILQEETEKLDSANSEFAEAIFANEFQ